MIQRRSPANKGPSGSRARGTATRGAPARAAASARPTASVRTTTDVGRSATRPASARRAAAVGAASRTSAPTSKRMTGRATALCLVLIALMLAYAYPVRLYLEQEAQIQQLQSTQAAERARISSLSAQSAEWNDPAFIKAQARARFFMVPPGTKTYVVLTPPTAAPASTAKAATTPWYGQLWSNIRGADDPGAAR
jgi:cell division protein FtsB